MKYREREKGHIWDVGPESEPYEWARQMGQDHPKVFNADEFIARFEVWQEEAE